MSGRSFWCQFDAFAKPLKDFRIQTVSGALVSILSSLVIVFLFISELIAYTTPLIRQEIVVDINRGRKMTIKLDLTYFYVPCVMLNLDTMDTTGEQQIDVKHQVYKTPVDTFGVPIADSTLQGVTLPDRRNDPHYCGSCYGAESDTRKCCNTCKEVQLAYHEQHWVVRNVSMFEQCREENWEDKLTKLGSEGCRIHGELQVNKVAGSFHIAPGSSFATNNVHVHNMQGLTDARVNMTHKISSLSFGPSYPDQVNPLDGVTMYIVEPFQMITYYMKLVPTIYIRHNDSTNAMDTVESNQYSVTWHSKGTPLNGNGQGIPGLFFNYEISPILVKISQEHKSFLHFLTNTCAIIGGVFTVASLVDAFIYHSTCVVRKRFSDHSH